MKTARFAFTKITVAGLDAMVHFYTIVLGLTEAFRVTLEDMDEVMLTAGGTDPHPMLILVRPHEAAPLELGNGYGPNGFFVEGLDEMLAVAGNLGGAVTLGPVEVPEMKSRVAFLADPEGHMIELIEPMHSAE